MCDVTTFNLSNVISAVCRFGLAAVWLVSGYLKLIDPVGTKKSVEAYELFSMDIAHMVGTVLPLVELALGVLLLLGVFLRPVAAVSALMFVGFAIGIGSAWARGLTIDCGCFGVGGENPDAGALTYIEGIGKDILFFLMAVWTVKRPFSRWAVCA